MWRSRSAFMHMSTADDTPWRAHRLNETFSAIHQRQTLSAKGYAAPAVGASVKLKMTLYLRFISIKSQFNE